MKKSELEQRIAELEARQIPDKDDTLAFARARHEQAERLLRDAGALLQRVEATYREIERRVSAGENREADYIDTSTTREAIRWVATTIGVQETSPGRFVGGYEAVAKRIQELCDAEDKAALLTAFFNVATLSRTAPGLFRDASAETVRARLVELTKDQNVPAAIRDRLNMAVSESRAVAESVERATRAAVAAASSLGLGWARGK